MNSNTTLLADFAEFIASKWNGEFQHSYEIPMNHNAWKAWRTKFSNINGDGNLWFCENLRQASERYSWSANGENIADLQNLLIQAITVHDEDSVIENCLKIFKWGGVAKNENDPSRRWLYRYKGQLSQQICHAVKLLKESSADLSDFNGNTLLMNSAMTKVYWAADADKNLAIYDGRVGAALGLLSREFVIERGWNVVPEEIAFSWGSSRDKHVRGQIDKRNPSDQNLKFPRLFTGKNKDFDHALTMRKASFLLTRTALLLGNSTTVNDLEQALFMVGYSVRRPSH